MQFRGRALCKTVNLSHALRKISNIIAMLLCCFTADIEIDAVWTGLHMFNGLFDRGQLLLWLMALSSCQLSVQSCDLVKGIKINKEYTRSSKLTRATSWQSCSCK